MPFILHDIRRRSWGLGTSRLRRAATSGMRDQQAYDKSRKDQANLALRNRRLEQEAHIHTGADGQVVGRLVSRTDWRLICRPMDDT